MKLSNASRLAAGLCAVALFAGCGGSHAQPGAPGVLPAAPAIATHAAGGDLLYVSDTQTGAVYVFSYPKGQLKATLPGFTDPGGECVDAHGNVFVTNTGASNVLEYAHGGTSQIATLKDAGYFPIGCAVDPTTGNLAVTNFSTSGSAPGDVVIYKHAKGRPTGHFRYRGIDNMLLCGYDDAGNLFVDGLSAGSAFAFVELRAGGAKLTNVTLDQSIANPGGVQWDGKYVAVGDQATNVIYRFSISGNKGTKVGTTTLAGANEVFQFWIDGTRVVGPDAYRANVGIWKYPAGGSPTKTISGVYVPLGATVSKAQP